MKYCKTCGVLYTTDVCPKCGVVTPDDQESAPAEPKTVRKQWIALLIAVPAAILLIMGVLYLLRLL